MFNLQSQVPGARDERAYFAPAALILSSGMRQ